MVAQTLIRGSLVFLFALTATSSALADETARGGYRNAFARDVCTPALVASSSYRDFQTRIGAENVAVETAKRTNGYRDAYARTRPENTVRQVARAGPVACRY
jgi:hypothetical protein